MTRKRTLAIAGTGLLVSLGLIGGIAMAQGFAPPPGGHEMHGEGMLRLFQETDRDQDGRVTAEEIEAARKARFGRADADADGALVLEEWQGFWAEMMRRPMVRGFQRLDDDGDGKVTEAELAWPTDRLLERLDANDDGAISRDELRPPRGRHGRKGGHGGDSGPGPQSRD